MERCWESSRFLPWFIDLGSMCTCLLRFESAWILLPSSYKSLNFTQVLVPISDTSINIVRVFPCHKIKQLCSHHLWSKWSSASLPYNFLSLNLCSYNTSNRVTSSSISQTKSLSVFLFFSHFLFFSLMWVSGPACAYLD
jgi:hypothetical protein